MRRSMLLPVLTALALVPLAAHAQAPGETAPLALPSAPEVGPGEGVVEVHYGKQIVIADLITIGASTAGILAFASSGGGGEGTGMLLGMGMSTYLLTAPIIHLVHGETRAAGISVALRAGLPYALGAAFGRLGPKDTICSGGPSSSCSNPTSVTGTVIGAAVGAVAAMYLDARYNSTHHEAAPPRFAPSVGYAPGGLTLGVGGAF